MKLNKIALAALASFLMVGCGATPSPTATPETSPTGEDVTSQVEAYLAKELESESTAEACTAKEIKWVCNFTSATREGDSLIIKVGDIEVPGGLKAVASGYKNFLSNPESPLTDVTDVTVESGDDSVSLPLK